MPEVRPFTGLLYDPAAAGPLAELVAPPYDAISPADQDRFYRASPYNVIRLILGRRELADDGSTNQYTRAASLLGQWRAAGILRPTPQPSLFPFEVRFHLDGKKRRVRGVIAEVALEDWGGSIIPHERTLPGPLEDRRQLLRTVMANLCPVYAILPGPLVELADFLDRAMERRPYGTVPDESGTRHCLWVTADETDRVTRALARQPLMIADGHHRFSVALAYREEMQSRFGPGPWDSMMMLLVDAASEDPPVLPIHRLVIGSPTDLGQRGERVRDTAEILATIDDDDLTYGLIRRDGTVVVHEVGRLVGSPPTVCALHEQVLDRVEGRELRFLPDVVAAERAVLEGQAREAFLLPATRVERVWAVVQSGQRFPQKSTYFWPKPRIGMVIRPLE